MQEIRCLGVPTRRRSCGGAAAQVALKLELSSISQSCMHPAAPSRLCPSKTTNSSSLVEARASYLQLALSAHIMGFSGESQMVTSDGGKACRPNLLEGTHGFPSTQARPGTMIRKL